MFKKGMKAILLDLIYKQSALTNEQIKAFHTNHKSYKNAFVINMANRTDRLESAQRTLDKMGIKFYRFIAILGKTVVDEPEYSSRFNVLRPGELGCLLSHLCILALAADHPNQNAFTLVFEDDIITSSGRDAFLATVDRLEALDRHESIQMVYLGKCLERCGQMIHIEDNIYRAVAPYCTHAFAIKNSFGRKILNDLDGCNEHKNSILNPEFFNRGIDSIYGDYIVHGQSKALVLHPAMFYQDVLLGGSDLRQEYMINYQECNDTNPNNCPPPQVDAKEDTFLDTNNANRMKPHRIMIVILIITIIILLIIWHRALIAKVLATRPVE